jgi:hypothetical protein
MKQFFKVLFVSMLYRCEIKQSWTDTKKKTTRWTFKLHPRKVPVTILTTLLSPIVFFPSGYLGVIDLWSGRFKIQSWSSYEIWSLTKPSNADCYALF